MIIIVLVLLLTGSAISLVLAIDHDGYGSRPVPRSHEDSFDPARRVW